MSDLSIILCGYIYELMTWLLEVYDIYIFSLWCFICWNFYACQLWIIWRRDIYFL